MLLRDWPAFSVSNLRCSEPMTMTRVMGSVLGMDRKPADSDAETVEATAAQSPTSLSTHHWK